MTTPLDRIRSAELAAARRIDEARSGAQRRIVDARRRVEGAVGQAGETGDHEADRRYTAAVEQARAEADRITAEARDQIAQLRHAVEPRIEDLADAMLDLILAPPEERGV